MPTRPINAVVLHEILHQANGAFEDISGDQFNAILKYEKPCSSVVRALNEAGSKPQLILTFDDGHQSDFDIVFPLLKDAGATATFFIVPDFVGKKGHMTWDDIRALHQGGMEIGSHSFSHPDFRTLSDVEAEYELSASKATIEQEINAEVSSFAFPFGFAPRRFYATAVSVGYSYVMGSHHGLIQPSKPHIMPRNSIHSAMTRDQILSVLDAGFSRRVRWSVEDKGKTVLKRMLPQPIYFRLRKHLASWWG